MTDVLGVLAARSLGVPAAVRPAIRPLYDGGGGLLAAPGDGVPGEEAGPAVAGEATEVDGDAGRDAGHRAGPRATAPGGAATRATDVVVRDGEAGPAVAGEAAARADRGRDDRDGTRDAAASTLAEDRAPAAYGVRAASGATPVASAATARASGVEPSDVGGAGGPSRAAGAVTGGPPAAPRTPPRRDAAERVPAAPRATEPPGAVAEPPATLTRAATPVPPLVPVAVEPRRTAARTARDERAPVPEAREARGDDGTPVVHVSIGRIDVRAVPAPAPERRSRSAPKRPTVGLEEYLRARDGRR